MKLLILLIFIVEVSSEKFFNSPVLTAYPCADTKDVLIWYDPSLPAREKNRYYVYIKKELPADSLLIIKFNTDAQITFNVQTERQKFVRLSLKSESEKFIMRIVLQSFDSIGFVVKGAIPGEIPYITSLFIRGEEICTRPNKFYLEKYLEDSWDSGPQENCGRSKVEHEHKSNIARSGRTRKSRRGDWPWHVAIYKSEESVSQYKCGGTIMSKTYVLTAAHCVSVRGIPLLPEMLTVILGRFDLKRTSKKSKEKEVYRIITHQLYHYQSLYSDIALLKLRSEVTFNTFIQPACLWYKKATEKLPTTEILGTIVGWGFNQKSGVSYRLRETQIPMVSDNTCLMSDLEFFGAMLVDDTKFCAGDLNITSACNGDSGSAFQVFVPDDEEDTDNNTSGAYYVRGIVSLTVSQIDKPVCAPNQYILFTDVNLYITWIKAYVDVDDY